jgi:hypothetical protein
LSEEDLDDLLVYHQEFRQSLAKPKKKPEPEEGPEPAPAVAEDEESAGSGDFGTQVTEAEELGAEDVITDEPSDAFGTAVVDSDVIEAPPEPGELALEAERAMAGEDDEEVLRVLHREIMSVAEHVLKGDFDGEFPVWQTLKSSGWYDIKQTTLAISPVEQFYSIAEEVCAKNLEGIAQDEIKSFVRESEVGKFLLKLGEMFKRQEL